MNEKLLLHVSKAEDCFVRYCFDCRAARVAVGPCDGCGADLSDGTAMVGIGLALQQQIKELLRALPERMDVLIAMPCLECGAPSMLIEATRGERVRRLKRVCLTYNFKARCRNGHEWETLPPGRLQFLHPRKPKAH